MHEEEAFSNILDEILKAEPFHDTWPARQFKAESTTDNFRVDTKLLDSPFELQS